MNIYFDENMPFAKAFFGELGNLIPFAGRDLCAEQLVDADVLLVRSITKVNQALLKNSPNIKFVGTATIGMDHIDQDHLAHKDIDFHSAPGCNAVSVSEYVVSALVILSEKYSLTLKSLTVGIVGGGNTGTRLAEKLTALGVQYKICDPLLADKQTQATSEDQTYKQDNRQYVSLSEVLNCDVISLHVPQINEGEYPTHHLLNEQNLTVLTDKQILISACRGAVIDNQALLKLKQQGHGLKLVLDVWEGEPEVLLPLIKYTDIATAHIAGYSLEGKSRGTEMLYQALCHQLNSPISHQLNDFLPQADIACVTLNKSLSVGNETGNSTIKIVDSELNQLIKLVYDVRRDDTIFRQQLSTQGFDNLRKNYPTRREFSSLVVNSTKNENTEKLTQQNNSQWLNQLYDVGFSKS